MYLRLLCAVFLLSVPLTRCAIKTSSKTVVNVTVTPDAEVAVQRPQLSTLDKYLQKQRSIAIVNLGNASDFLMKSPGVQNITSDNYPFPYPVTKGVKLRLSVANATGMNININDLDIDPASDFISLIPINNEGVEGQPIILTGKLKQPLSIRSLGYTKANLIFRPKTSETHLYRGFFISYAPYGEDLPPGTQPPDITLAYEQLQTGTKLLVIPHNLQNETTWNKLKQLFAVATNSYRTSLNLTLERAYPENVTLTRVAECFSSWPDSENCVEVEYAITLYNDSSKIVDVDPFLEDRTPREPAGLTSIQLEEMWAKFGRSMFKENDIEEYVLPDTRAVILMWVGIAIGVCVLLFLIFVAVFRSPAIRDRFVEDDTIAIKSSDQNNGRTNDDITMYPSPDQVIPEMYPGNQTGGSNGQVPPSEFAGDTGRARQNTFETINEGYTEDETPSTRIKGRRTEQSQADASV